MSSKSKRTSEGTQRSPGTIIAAGVAVVLLAAGAIAIGTSTGSDDAAAPSVTVEGGVAAAQFQKVTVTGDVLVPRGDGATDPAAGVAAPTLEGYTFSGRPMTIDPGADGRPTMLVFLAHWCPHCNREVPELLKWREQGGVPENLRIVGIPTASRNDQPNWPPSDWLEEFKWPWEVLADSEQQTAAQAYGVDGFPFAVIVDGAGNVKTRWSGELGADGIDAAVKDALATT